MRISDWSSDVCSSDLAEGKPATRYAAAIGMTETIGPHSGYWYAGELPDGLDGTMGPPLGGMEFRIADPDTGEICANGTPGELQEIGNAPCRERVCQAG